MKNRVLLVLLVAAGVAWLAASSWVRPVALAVFAGSLALLLWPRIRGSAPKPPASADAPESSKDLWDALDRGDDPTDSPR